MLSTTPPAYSGHDPAQAEDGEEDEDSVPEVGRVDVVPDG